MTLPLGASPTLSAADPWQAWREAQLRCADRRARLDRQVDLEFWARHAAEYDRRSSLARQAPAVVQRVCQLVGRPASLLDLGCGTGGFSLPLADRVGRLTALDHSPHMLAELERQLETGGPRNVTTLLADADTATLDRHEVVLSANALYRVLDLRPWLERASAAAERLVLLVLSVGRQPPFPPSWRELLGPRLAEGAGLPELLAGLRALGSQPRVELLRAPRVYRYPDLEAALAALARSLELNAAERQACRAELAALLAPDGGELAYRVDQRVALVHWVPRP